MEYVSIILEPVSRNNRKLPLWTGKNIGGGRGFWYKGMEINGLKYRNVYDGTRSRIFNLFLGLINTRL